MLCWNVYKPQSFWLMPCSFIYQVAATLTHPWSRDSVVGIATSYGLDGGGVGV
jgi:hypothetical protein